MKKGFWILLLLGITAFSCNRQTSTGGAGNTEVGTVPDYMNGNYDPLDEEAEIFDREKTWDGTSRYNEAEDLLNEGLTNDPGYPADD